MADARDKNANDNDKNREKNTISRNHSNVMKVYGGCISTPNERARARVCTLARTITPNVFNQIHLRSNLNRMIEINPFAIITCQFLFKVFYYLDYFFHSNKNVQ